jgi:two-component system nitrogen regulation response regulator GlnG
MKRCAKALELKKPIQRQVAQNNLNENEQDVLPLVGKTPVMQRLYRLVAGLMNADLPILVCGESGTGKTLITQMLHNFSDRRNLPFVTVSEEDLIEIEGLSKILARAKGGTILFEQVSDIKEEYQGRIVRMIDNQLDHSPHFIATMNEDANQAVEKGLIRRDLYYRLGGPTIQVPTLRERIDDVILLSDFFLAKSEHDGVLVRNLSPEAVQIFRNYSWPGNVRQLENVVKLLGLTGRSASISLGEAEQVLKDQPAMGSAQKKGSTDKLATDVERHLRRYFDLHGNMLPAPGLYGRIVREVEQPLIELALESTGGNQAKCADLLGINRNTLRKKINELDIKVTRRRKLT